MIILTSYLVESPAMKTKHIDNKSFFKQTTISNAAVEKLSSLYSSYIPPYIFLNYLSLRSPYLIRNPMNIG